MSFLHLSLLAGLAVITVPIMLHMFGQKQPQLIEFPALRFVRQTTQEQSSSWQLRHFLLLLLRILLLAALALALARPRVHSAMLGSILGATTVGVFAALATLITAIALVTKRPRSIWLTCGVIALSLWASAGLWGFQSLTRGPTVPSSDSSAPVAAVIIVDNGPTMGYMADNQTRLAVAKDMATWILDQLPVDSQVGILSGVPVGSLVLDPATAKTQVKLIETRGAHIDLTSRIRSALDLVLANELERKEVYVVSDLMSTAWESGQADVGDLLAEHQDEVLLQLIDVGEDETLNWQLGDVENDLNTVAAGGSVTFNVDVRRSSQAADAQKAISVELNQQALDPRLPVISNNQLVTPPTQVVDRQVISLADKASATVQLSARDLAAGTHHFTIRLDKPDPLLIDNERYVTISAREQPPTLIVADDSLLADMLKLLADPSGARGPDGAPLVSDIRFVQLTQVQLAKYAVICLYDPPPLSADVAQLLKEHVLSGGGLLVVLGPNLEAGLPLTSAPLLDVLPGRPSQVLVRDPRDRSVFLDPIALTHPIFQELAPVANEIPWNLFPIFRSWTFEALTDNAVVLAKLSDGSQPVVISHDLGRGQVITLTTPVPEVENRPRPLWNELWVGSDPWPAYALLLGTLRTLSGADQASLNFQAGEPVSLNNDSFSWPSRYELFRPAAQSSERVDAADNILLPGRFDHPGTYHLRGQLNGPVSRGFSINVPADDTQLQRVTPLQLDERLGAEQYRIARSRDEVESSVGQARFGRELYPLLMVFVAGLFLAEQAMSNRFYKIKFSRAKGA